MNKADLIESIQLAKVRNTVGLRVWRNNIGDRLKQFRLYRHKSKKRLKYWFLNKIYKIQNIYRTIIGWTVHHKKEIATFIHITISIGLIIWGIELIIASIWPMVSVWRVFVGIYALAWVGLAYLKELFKIGVYLN